MSSPDDLAWLDELRRYRDINGGKKAAEVIGYSATVVSQVLSATYKGDLSAVKAKVEGALMGMTVDCPVVGELPRNRCLEYQRLPFSATNPMRVRLAQTCPTCPHYKGAKK